MKIDGGMELQPIIDIINITNILNKLYILQIPHQDSKINIIEILN